MLRNRKGFTLIELLVVIAIIAILAAILFPVFARARAKAQQANCLSNVKQIALGFQMYMSDYDSWFPSPCHGWWGRTQWPTAIMPYLKNEQILVDPSATSTPTMGCGARSNYIGQWEAGGVNGTPPDPLKLADVAYPAEMFIIICSNQQGGWDGSGWAHYLATGGYSSFGEVAFLHNDGANVGFVDGHAKWMARQTLIAMPRPWGISNQSGAHPRLWFGNDFGTWPQWVR